LQRIKKEVKQNAGLWGAPRREEFVSRTAQSTNGAASRGAPTMSLREESVSRMVQRCSNARSKGVPSKPRRVEYASRMARR
jgi:hypothetical protein